MYSINYKADGTVNSIFREDGACIPIAEGNRDYQAFLAWNTEQDPPLSLDPITVQQVKDDTTLISDFLAREDRDALWAALVRKFGLSSDIARSQFDADPASFTANPIINDMVTPKILAAVRQDPAGLQTTLAAAGFTYNPYVES